MTALCVIVAILCGVVRKSNNMHAKCELDSVFFDAGRFVHSIHMRVLHKFSCEEKNTCNKTRHKTPCFLMQVGLSTAFICACCTSSRARKKTRAIKHVTKRRVF